MFRLNIWMRGGGYGLLSFSCCVIFPEGKLKKKRKKYGIETGNWGEKKECVRERKVGGKKINERMHSRIFFCFECYCWCAVSAAIHFSFVYFDRTGAALGWKMYVYVFVCIHVFVYIYT